MQEKKQVRSRPSNQDDYPVRRGLLGNFLYGVGMLATRLLTRFSCIGKENIPTTTPYVIAANHQTYIDGLWILSALPKDHFPKMACIAGADLFTDHGLLGQIIVRVGRAIPLNRAGSPVRGLIMAKNKVTEGNILLVHPEGTRTHDGKVAELQDGAAYIALKANVPLLPIFIEGGYDIFPRTSKWPRPFTRKGRRKTLTLHIGKPLYPANYKKAPEMTADLTRWMLEHQDRAEDRKQR